MANVKQIFLYNLKPEVTDEQYDEFLRTYKGPIISRLPHNVSFNMLRVDRCVQGPAKYQYVGIVEVTDLENWDKDCACPEYQKFQQDWLALVDGEFVYWDTHDIGLWINPTKAGDKFLF